VKNQKNDIADREDLLRLLEVFYKKIFSDPSISYIFTDVAHMNMEEHIPVIADFWETVLFQKNIYQKNAMQVHVALNQQTPLTTDHFTTWLNYFNETVDELFEGNNAFAIKQRALSIATIMQIKIRQNPAIQ
jgi:hemoglobin